ncbi:MAG: hypothetical protein AB7O44_27450 [Hyphomicrobiaceae bacterium]
MIDTLKRAYHDTPDDAARIAIVAGIMPILFWLYLLGPTQLAARVTFTVSVGFLGLLVGLLVQERRDLLGYAVGSCAIGATIAALGSLFALDDPTMTWRVVMAGSQGVVVLGWFLLWRARKKWLSRTLALSAFIVAAAGYAFYLLGNFGLPDPAIAAPWTWGWTEPKGVLRRVLDLPIEPLLGMCLWAALLVNLRRFLRSNGDSD